MQCWPIFCLNSFKDVLAFLFLLVSVICCLVFLGSCIRLLLHKELEFVLIDRYYTLLFFIFSLFVSCKLLNVNKKSSPWAKLPKVLIICISRMYFSLKLVYVSAQKGPIYVLVLKSTSRIYARWKQSIMAHHTFLYIEELLLKLIFIGGRHRIIFWKPACIEMFALL